MIRKPPKRCGYMTLFEHRNKFIKVVADSLATINEKLQRKEMEKILVIMICIFSLNVHAEYIPTKQDKSIVDTCSYILYGTLPKDEELFKMTYPTLMGRSEFAYFLSVVDKNYKSKKTINRDMLMKVACSRALADYSQEKSNLSMAFSMHLLTYLVEP